MELSIRPAVMKWIKQLSPKWSEVRIHGVLWWQTRTRSQPDDCHTWPIKKLHGPTPLQAAGSWLSVSAFRLYLAPSVMGHPRELRSCAKCHKRWFDASLDHKNRFRRHTFSTDLEEMEFCYSQIFIAKRIKYALVEVDKITCKCLCMNYLRSQKFHTLFVQVTVWKYGIVW